MAPSTGKTPPPPPHPSSYPDSQTSGTKQHNNWLSEAGTSGTFAACIWSITTAFAADKDINGKRHPRQQGLKSSETTKTFTLALICVACWAETMPGKLRQTYKCKHMRIGTGIDPYIEPNKDLLINILRKHTTYRTPQAGDVLRLRLQGVPTYNSFTLRWEIS